MSSSGSYQLYRKTIHSLNPPMIPYLGTFSTDDKLPLFEEKWSLSSSYNKFNAFFFFHRSVSARLNFHWRNSQFCRRTTTHSFSQKTTHLQRQKISFKFRKKDKIFLVIWHNKSPFLTNFTVVIVVIEEIQRYQQEPYKIKPVEHIQSLLRQLSYKTDKELYELSLIREPREVQDKSLIV